MQYANDLISCSPDVGVCLILIPQGRLGKLAPLIEKISKKPLNMRILVPSIRQVLTSLFKILVSNIKKSKQEHEYIFEEYNFSFSSNSINEESRWFLYEGIYSSIFKGVLPKQTKKIFNFSLKGRYAIFEKNVADLAAISIASIQTANLDASKSYDFPVNDFYCDSRISYKLGMKGFSSSGQLLYEGCPFRVKKLSIVKKISKITFFTQPYEFDINLAIIKFLVKWSKKNDVSCVIKLHPRDDRAKYSSLEEGGQGAPTFSSSGTGKQAIEMTDVCITRTSAIGLEALALGVPSLYCLFSSYDHSVKYGYLNLVKHENLYANNIKELERYISNPYLLTEKFEKIQDNVFGGKDIVSLSSNLIGHEACDVK